MVVGAEADQRAQRREQQRQRQHQRDDPRRHAEFDDHHAVQRADQQNGRHADRHLKQRQAQQPRHRQLRASPASAKGSRRGADLRSRCDDGGAGAVHDAARLQGLRNIEAAVDAAGPRDAPAFAERRDRRMCRSSARREIGAIAGARSPRGKEPPHGMHDRQRWGARRDGEEDRFAGAPARPASVRAISGPS